MFIKLHKSRYNKKILVALVMFLLFLLLITCSDQENLSKTNFHVILGKEESCLSCHNQYYGFAASHDPGIIGCTPCHLGDPSGVTESKAHKNMILIPGNLSDANKTCGASNCHAEIIPRIEESLMTTLSGMITVDKFVFGEHVSLSDFHHVSELGKKTPADLHLRQLCVSCHLGNEKVEVGPITESSRGGGCNACHLQYDQGKEINIQQKRFYHPSLTIAVDNDKCFGCHSRSGRISTNYEGWHETNFDFSEIPDSGEFRLLEDQRVFRKMKADIHHEKGMECIDCHNAKDVMGDGIRYLHQEEAVTSKCEDCHQKSPIKTTPFDSLDIESKKLINLRNWDVSDKNFVVNSQGEPLYNVFTENNEIVVRIKNKSKSLYAKPPKPECTHAPAHANLSCQSCHSGWAPQCIGCHHTFEPETLAYDHLEKSKSAGKWVEYIGAYFADLPPMGKMFEKKDDREIEKIKTFVSGMILSIDGQGYSQQENDLTFNRYFAPLDPHTTQRNSRNCKSCHLSPLAIGYGRGTLTINAENKWIFNADFVSDPHDNLPQDAWIDFNDKKKKGHATRENAQSLNEDDQIRVLRVGACLTCHSGTSPIMQRSLYEFDDVFQSRTSSCIIPES